MDNDMTTRSVRQQDFAELRAGLKQFGGGAVMLALRAVALVVYVLTAMAEPLISSGPIPRPLGRTLLRLSLVLIPRCLRRGCSFGVVLSVLAFGTFVVAVLFGFLLQAPFPHRWEMLFASVGFMLLYGAYLGLLSMLQRFCRAN